MQSFNRYFREKMQDTEFRSFYKSECHVCAGTMQIFEKVSQDGITLAAIGKEVGADPEALAALRDADHCDPHLVILLSRHLGLIPPAQCPRLGADDG